MPTIAAATASVAAPGTPACFEERRERESGRRAAGQRHRAREHAHQRMLSEPPRDRGADDVLQRGDHDREDEEQEDQRSAAPQQRQAGGEPDRREEGVLQRHLQRRVELERLIPGNTRHRQDRGDRQAAADRRGNVHARQRRNQPPESVAEKEDDAGEGDGLNEIQLEQDGHAAGAAATQCIAGIVAAVGRASSAAAGRDSPSGADMTTGLQKNSSLSPQQVVLPSSTARHTTKREVTVVPGPGESVFSAIAPGIDFDAGAGFVDAVVATRSRAEEVARRALLRSARTDGYHDRGGSACPRGAALPDRGEPGQPGTPSSSGLHASNPDYESHVRKVAEAPGCSFSGCIEGEFRVSGRLLRFLREARAVL